AYQLIRVETLLVAATFIVAKKAFLARHFGSRLRNRQCVRFFGFLKLFFLEAIELCLVNSASYWICRKRKLSIRNRFNDLPRRKFLNHLSRAHPQCLKGSQFGIECGIVDLFRM